MKKIIIILSILPLLFLCSFKIKAKPYVLLSSGTISTDATKRMERVFVAGQRINYALVAPDGLKNPEFVFKYLNRMIKLRIGDILLYRLAIFI